MAFPEVVFSHNHPVVLESSPLFWSHHCYIFCSPIRGIYPVVEKITLELWSFLFCCRRCEKVRFRSGWHSWCYVCRFIELRHLHRCWWCFLNRGFSNGVSGKIEFILESQKPIQLIGIQLAFSAAVICGASIISCVCFSVSYMAFKAGGWR